MYTVTRAERETVILWDAESRNATIDTADPVTLRKLDKLAAEYPEVYRLVSTYPLYTAKRYEVPSSYIRFGKPPSAAQREAWQETGKRAASNLSRKSPSSNREISASTSPVIG